MPTTHERFGNLPPTLLRVSIANADGDEYVIITRHSDGRWIAEDGSNMGDDIANSDSTMFGIRNEAAALIADAVAWAQDKPRT